MVDHFQKEYRELTADESMKIIKIKEQAEVLWNRMQGFDENEMGSEQKSRELSIAFTHLQDAVMWATRHWAKAKEE